MAHKLHDPGPDGPSRAVSILWPEDPREDKGCDQINAYGKNINPHGTL